MDTTYPFLQLRVSRAKGLARLRRRPKPDNLSTPATQGKLLCTQLCLPRCRFNPNQ